MPRIGGGEHRGGVGGRRDPDRRAEVAEPARRLDEDHRPGTGERVRAGRTAGASRTRRSRRRSPISGSVEVGRELLGERSACSRSPVTSTISAPNRSACLSAWKPSIRTRSVGGRAGTVAGACLVARLAAAVPEHVVDGGRGRVADARATSSSTACSAQARISTSSGESCSIRVSRSIRPDEVVVEREHAVDAQHVRDEVVGEQRQAVEAGRVGQPGEREVGGGDLGALEERDPVVAVGRDVVPGVPARELAWPAPRRCRSGRRPGTNRPWSRAPADGARSAPSARARRPDRASPRSLPA